MKILHLLWTAHFGGIERLAIDLAKAQSDVNEIRADVLFGRSEGEMLPQFRSAGLTFKGVHLSHGFDISPRSLRELKQIYSDYDVLHFHTFIPAMALAAIGSAAKIVYTEHGNFGIGRRPTMTDRVKWSLLGRFLRRHADFVSFNSHYTRKIAERRYGLQAVARDVIYNGIDFSAEPSAGPAIIPQVQDRIRGKFIVGTSSRFAAFKRIDRLIEAFNSFSAGRDTVLLLVGDGPARGEFESMVRTMGISDKVIFAGYQENVRLYQEAMNVCVFPSQGEPFGLAAVETLALGKPTLVFSDSGGLSEIIGNCDTADVVDDVPHLVRRLEHHYAARQVMDEGKKRERMLYVRRFDIRTMANTFAGVYNRVLPSAGRAMTTSAVPTK